MQYLFEPRDVISLIRSIHESDNMGQFRGNVSLTRENSGPSGEKFRSLIAELNSKMKGKYCYLEIGIYRGRTIITSAVDNPATQHIGVDNFSQFDPERKNAARVYNAIEDLKLRNIEIIEDDFMQYFMGQGRNPQRNIGVYFYDAIHDYRSQIIGLMQGARMMAPGGVMLVDDTNYAHVRYSVYDFIEANPDFKLLFETFTYMHPSNMNPQDSKSAKKG